MGERVAPASPVTRIPGLPFGVRGREGVRRPDPVLPATFPDPHLDDIEDAIAGGYKALA